MEQETQINQMLSLMIQPGFCVRDQKIAQVNQAAQQLLLCPGADVRGLITVGLEEYDAFTDGCLYLQLNLGGGNRGAAVLRIAGYDVFVLDPEPENSELYALALAAQGLRSPMCNVVVAADQIGRTAAQSGDPQAIAQAGELAKGINQVLRVINNMSDALLYSELTQQETLNLSAVFDEIFEKAQTLLDQAGCHLTYTGLNEDVSGLADAQQLERAVLNILSNAARFAPAGGSIAARLTRRGKTLRLTIEDQGPGIREDVLGNIFHRYLRHPGIEDGRYGIGLGMALVRTVAANHGGAVLIDQPRGARVTMTMSLRQSKDTRFRSPVLRVDYAGGRDHGLLELSQVLPADLYTASRKE